MFLGGNIWYDYRLLRVVKVPPQWRRFFLRHVDSVNQIFVDALPRVTSRLSALQAAATGPSADELFPSNRHRVIDRVLGLNCNAGSLHRETRHATGCNGAAMQLPSCVVQVSVDVAKNVLNKHIFTCIICIFNQYSYIVFLYYRNIKIDQIYNTRLAIANRSRVSIHGRRCKLFLSVVAVSLTVCAYVYRRRSQKYGRRWIHASLGLGRGWSPRNTLLRHMCKGKRQSSPYSTKRA